MLRQCDSAAKAVICFAYRCNVSSHALAAAISASLQGERGSVSSRAQRQHDFSFAAGGKRKRLLTRSRSCYFSFAAGGKEASPHGLSDSMISASLQWGRGSGGSLSCRRQRWKLTHQLWVESQTRIKDAQTVRFRSQSCHLFRLSLQRLLTRSRSCYFSFAAGGKKRKRLLTGSAQV